MPTIASTQNETFQKFLSLTTAKGLKKEGLLLLSGESLIREFLQKPHLQIHAELVTGKLKPLLPQDRWNPPPLGEGLGAGSKGAPSPAKTKDLLKQVQVFASSPSRGEEIPGQPAHLNGEHAKTIHLSAELFAEIDVVGTGFNILVLQQPVIEKLTVDDIAAYKPTGMELVMPIGDPGNLGALIRSAEAFGVTRGLLTEEAAHPFLPKSVKSSAGSVLRLPLARGPALSQFPKNCIALDRNGTSIDEFAWPHNGLLVVGEEGRGLGKAAFKQRITIPTQGVESLNAVVAASIALAFWRKHSL